MNQKESEILKRFDKMLHEHGASNDFLLSIANTCFDYLNPLTISEYKDKYGMSYNGVKKCRKKVIILKKSYVIDND